jgi:hypothetical protein
VRCTGNPDLHDGLTSSFRYGNFEEGILKMPTSLPTRAAVAARTEPQSWLGHAADVAICLLLPFFAVLLLSATTVGNGRLSLNALGETLEMSHQACPDFNECMIPLEP